MLVALALLIATPKVLIEATRASDSSSRDRGAYALARTFDPADESATTLVRNLLERGEADQHDAIRRGLMSRTWSSRPSWLDSMMNDALGRRLTPTWEAFLVLPHEDAVQLVLRDLREHGPQSSGIALAPMLDDDRLREPLREQHRLRGTAQLFFQGKCTIEGCHAALCELSWLGEDLSKLYARYDGREFIPSETTATLIASVRACGKEGGDLGAVRKSAREWVDPLWRRQLLEYLISLPGSPRAEAIAAAADLAHDPNGRVRSRAVQLLSVVAGRSSDAAISSALIYSLADTDPDIRLDAVAGLLAMHAGSTELAAQRKKETDLAVQGLLDTSP